MTESIVVTPAAGPLSASIRPPGSKSITNRALVCAALAQGTSELSGALDSEDTQVMIAALVKLGVRVERDATARRLTVTGCAGALPAGRAELYVANSGTTIRFLTALAALGHGEFHLDGAPRMRERPIADLVSALNRLGVRAECSTSGGFPPVVVHADGLPGGRVQLRGDVSSQFLSGLLMAAPYAHAPLDIEIEGTLVSQPYVQMTLAVMSSFGVSDVTAASDLSRFHVPAPQCYQRQMYAIEPDASAASYFFAAAAIVGGSATVQGLSRRSLQGDVAFVQLLERMGCRVAWQKDSITVTGGPLRGVTADMNAISDTVQTLAAVAVFASGPTTVTGVGHIRHKETDRIAALATELRKLGASVDETTDGLVITPAPLHAAAIDTYEDHRMAMSLALVGLRVPGVEIRDPGCTAKTYPDFFADLARVTGAKA